LDKGGATKTLTVCLGRASLSSAGEKGAPGILMGLSKRLHTLAALSKSDLQKLWPQVYSSPVPSGIGRDLLMRFIAYRIQEQVYGGLPTSTRRRVRELYRLFQRNPGASLPNTPDIKPGTRLVRQWKGKTHIVTVDPNGFDYNGQCYSSMSEIARLITGTRWSGPLFFGIRTQKKAGAK